MGNYATTTSIPVLLPNFLNGDTTTADTQGTAIFSKAITRAEDYIDSLLGARFQTPFSQGSVPPTVSVCTEEMAVFFAIRATYAQDGQIRQDYLDDFNTAVQKITRIAEGKVALILSDGSAAPSRGASRFRSTTKNFTPITGRDCQKNWKRDPDEISDTNSDRGGTGSQRESDC